MNRPRDPGPLPVEEIYLDHNASSPLLPQAREAVLDVLDLGPGNASSAHGAGRRLRKALGDAREAVADLVGVTPVEVVFTSGATEADHLGILGLLRGAPSPRSSLVTTRAEHPAVSTLCDRLEADGVPVRRAPVDRWGRVRAQDVVAYTDETTAVVAVTLAQSVTGALQPVGRIGDAARRVGARLHVDAAQAVGRIDVDADRLRADTIAVSAHKMGGPTGIGALVIRRDTPFEHPWADGAHELGRRPGTPAVALAAGFGAAAKVARERLTHVAAHTSGLIRDVVVGVGRIRGGQVWSPTRDVLPNTCLLAFDGCPGDALMVALDARGIRVSVGSACASGARLPPAVLVAGGRTPDEAAQALRISVGAGTTAAHVEGLLSALGGVVATVRLAQQGV